MFIFGLNESFYFLSFYCEGASRQDLGKAYFT